MLVEGQNVVVDLSDDGVKINGTTATNPDVLARNGITHIIDQVLVSPNHSILR